MEITTRTTRKQFIVYLMEYWKNKVRERWIKSIPREDIPDKSDTSVCARHWPPNFESITVYGRRRPKHPLSVFDCVNPSQVPTAPSKSRNTTLALSSVRATIPGELSSFLEREKEKIVSSEKNNKNEIQFQIPVVNYSVADSITIQSTEFR